MNKPLLLTVSLIAAASPLLASLHATAEPQKAKNAVSSAPAAATRQRKKITADDAVKIIAARPEVKAWKKAVDAVAKERGVSAHIEVDRKENKAFVVHVYELVPDDAQSSHTATFNWYYVDERSGKVRKEF